MPRECYWCETLLTLFAIMQRAISPQLNPTLGDAITSSRLSGVCTRATYDTDDRTASQLPIRLRL